MAEKIIVGTNKEQGEEKSTEEEGNEGIMSYWSQKDKEDEGTSKKEEKLEHVCQICGRKLRYQWQLIRHSKSHERRYACSKCDKKFKRIDHLKQHERAIHSDERPYVCFTCHKSFKTSNYLRKHLKIHSKKQSYTCPICQMILKTSAKLKSHIAIHLEEQLKSLTCHICSRSFYNKSNLNTHLKAHSDKRSYKCQFCSRFYKTKQYLNIHTKRCQRKTLAKARPNPDSQDAQADKPHPMELFKCPRCRKTYIMFEYLNDHFANSHARSDGNVQVEKSSDSEEDTGSELSYVCHICNKKFNKLKRFNAHGEEMHRPVQLIICSQCGERFIRLKDYNRHFRYNSCEVDPNVQMESEEDASSNSSPLRESEKLSYVCQVCENIFNSSWELMDHGLAKHSRREKIFKCLKCSETFCTLLDLYRHDRLHYKRLYQDDQPEKRRRDDDTEDGNGRKKKKSFKLGASRWKITETI